MAASCAFPFAARTWSSHSLLLARCRSARVGVSTGKLGEVNFCSFVDECLHRVQEVLLGLPPIRAAPSPQTAQCPGEKNFGMFALAKITTGYLNRERL